MNIAREASAIILGEDGHEAYRRRVVSNVFVNHNDKNFKPDCCILIATHTTPGRKSGKFRSD